MTEREYKTFGLDITALDAAGRTVEGYAAVFGNLDLGADVIHPGAFAKTLAERGNKIKFLWQHDTAEPLGKVLELREDERGLFFKAVISDTARGRDALALLRDGAIGGMSIGYDAIVADFTKMPDGLVVRHLRELRLWEISLVSMPMNEEAGVTALKEHAPETAPEPDPEPESAPQTLETIVLELRARVEALEAKMQPVAAEATGAEPQAVDKAGPVEPPTAHLEAELKELELLLNIPTNCGGD